VKLSIDKNTLVALNQHRGELDKGSGKVFVGFVGAMNIDDRLFHGVANLQDAPSDDEQRKSFSLSAIVARKSKPLPKPQRGAPADKKDE
jgi:hypothetical protein